MSAAQAFDPNRGKTLKYYALPEDRRLHFAPRACLAARAIPEACRHCASACPVAALVVEATGPRLLRDCLGCGRCAAACPSGALHVEGLAGSLPLPNGNAALRLDCGKVPPAHSGGSHRVPCLLGLTDEDLLEWRALCSAAPLLLIDRGWCQGCSAGTAGMSLCELIAGANRMLEVLGYDSSQSLHVLREPLPEHLRPANIPAAASEEPLDRRAFFRRFASEAAQALPTARPPLLPARRGSDFPIPRRERLLRLLATLAPQQPLPAALLPEVSVAANCAHHALCAGLCPTGALQALDDGASLGLGYDPRACVACGLCQRVCPEGAITLRPAGRAGAVAMPHRLNSTPLLACERCAKPFPAVAGATVCPACQRHALIFHQLFGTHVANPGVSPIDSFRNRRGEP